MRIEKGDILIGTNPYTGEKRKYKYVGKTEIVHKGFDRELIEGGTKQHIIVGKEWVKAFNLKLFKKHGE